MPAASRQVSRVGTANKPPSMEETVGRLEAKMKEMELQNELKQKEDETEKDNLKVTLESFKATVEHLTDNISSLQEKLNALVKEQTEDKNSHNRSTFKISETMENLNGKVEKLSEALDFVQEKMYDFESNKKNNLIFYGIPNEPKERPERLIAKVTELIKINMKIRREMVITSASRMNTGPEVFRCRPVLVTFEEFRDREEVLKNSRLIKKHSISVTEDLSKRTRESRQELRKFMRHVKRINPEKRCFLQYDKLYVDGKLFIYNEATGSVEQAKNQIERGKSEDDLHPHRYENCIVEKYRCLITLAQICYNGKYKTQIKLFPCFSSFPSKLGIKSFSTTSLTKELEKEDKIKELENLMEVQKAVIVKQNQRITELEEVNENVTRDPISNQEIINENDDTQGNDDTPSIIEPVKICKEEENEVADDSVEC